MWNTTLGVHGLLWGSLVLGLPFVPARCSSSGKAEGAFEVQARSLAGEVKLKAGFRYTSDPNTGDRTVEIRNGASAPLCGTIEFFDENGDLIDPPGAIEVELPPASGSMAPTADIDVPDGATTHRVTSEDCESDDSNRSGWSAGRSVYASSAGAEVELLQSRQTRTWTFIYGTSVHDVAGTRPSKELTVAISLVGGNESEARLLADYTWEHGPWASPPGRLLRNLAPSGLDVIHYTETTYDGSALRLVVANDEVPSWMAVHLNGTLYADLEGGTRLASPAGWHALQFLVPAEDLEYDPIPGKSWTNAYSITSFFQPPARQSTSHVSGELTFTSGA